MQTYLPISKSALHLQLSSDRSCNGNFAPASSFSPSFPMQCVEDSYFSFGFHKNSND